MLTLIGGDSVEDTLSLAINAIQLLSRILQPRRIITASEERRLALGDDLIQGAKAVTIPGQFLVIRNGRLDIPHFAFSHV
jgi:hypothetical protein